MIHNRKYPALNPINPHHRLILARIKAIYSPKKDITPIWDKNSLLKEIMITFGIARYMGVWLWLKENKDHWEKTRK